MPTDAQLADLGSAGERAFQTTWRQMGGPDIWQREYRFDPVRKWRLDFAWPAPGGGGIAVEIDGGTWNGGRHVRGAGYEGDCRKLNAAAAAGWFVYRMTVGMAESPDDVELILRDWRRWSPTDG